MSSEATTTPRGKVSGKFVDQEINFIAENAATMTPYEIAKKLGRSTRSVSKYIRSELTVGKGDYKDKLLILDELRRSDIWIDAEDIFSEDELRMFETVWVQMCQQFNNDLEYTEKLQIRDLCRTEIMMNRNLIEQRSFAAQIEQLGKERTELVSHERFRSPDPIILAQARQELLQYDMAINNSKTAASNRETQYLKLHDNKQKIYDKISANRSDRVKDVLGGKVSLLSLLRSLDEKEVRDSEGRELELMKLATKKEFARLSEFHEYADGTLDRPFLTPEVVTEEDV